MFLASKLTDISSRFPAHTLEIRQFLLKERLRVPSPDAIPELSKRVGTDARFRADLASLMRAVLYREREGIGYEDLLGILVAAAAGTEHDLTSDSQEADIRELLRFLLQSRRSTQRLEAEEASAPTGAETREPLVVTSEPVQASPLQSTADSVERKPRFTESAVAVAVAEADNREPADPVLPFRTTGLFAAQPESPGLFAAHVETENPWWRVNSSWIVAMLAMLVGVGAGLVIARGVPAAHKHGEVIPAGNSSSKPQPGVQVASKESAAAKSDIVSAQKHSSATRQRALREAHETASADQTDQPDSVADGGAIVQQPELLEGRSTPPPMMPDKNSAVPMTVVKQVVRASLSAADGVDSDDAEPTAETRSIVHQGSAGMMPANVIYSPPPEYPAEASAARVQGQVTVRAVVDPEGKVIYTRVVSGPELLRDAALEAVQKWRYRPLLYNGRPIAVTTTAILDFKFAK